MRLFILLLLLAASALRLKLPVLESTLLSLLLTPILSFLLGHIISHSLAANLLGIILSAGSVFYLMKKFRSREEISTMASEERGSAGILIGAYLSFYSLCLLWPDFISIGERLRDYALLASTFHSPIKPLEPWMSDSPLLYYVFWYRFGASLGNGLGAPIWEMYHSTVAFCFTAYFAVIFRISSRFLRFSFMNSLLIALIVSLSSNVQGIINFLTKNDNWWGPSRVITGAIDEFPAWSFVLGDLHPHFANLMAVPFVLLIGFHLAGRSSRWSSQLVVPALMLILFPLFLFNANAWELAIWPFICMVLLPFWLFFSIKFVSHAEPSDNEKNAEREKRINILCYSLIGLLATVLFFSGSHLFTSTGSEQASASSLGFFGKFMQVLKLVRDPVTATPFSEMFLHWGLPLSILMCGVLFTERSIVRGVIFAVSFIATFPIPFFYHEGAIPEARWFLLVLFAALLIQEGISAWKEGSDFHARPSNPLLAAFTHGAPLIFLALILFPEFFFFDDSYGADIERMNTIFKFYTTAWFFGIISALLMLRKIAACTPQSFSTTVAEILPPALLKLLALALLLGFFYRTIWQRKTERLTVEPYAQGLSVLDQRFNGAGEAIKKFALMPYGVVLEGQGNAYDLTNHVTTLSSKQAFLGWGNHVGLLTGNYSEIQRREALTEKIYREKNCEANRQDLLNEKIDYVVFGPWERNRYPGISEEGLLCLNRVVREGDYSIFSLK